MEHKNKQVKSSDLEVWCLNCQKPYKLSVSSSCPNCFEVSETSERRSRLKLNKVISILLTAGILLLLILTGPAKGDANYIGYGHGYGYGYGYGYNPPDTPTETSSSGSGCLTDYLCGDWSMCNGTQTRDCTKVKNYCYAKPVQTSRVCLFLNQTIPEVDIISSTGDKKSNQYILIILIIGIIFILIIISIVKKYKGGNAKNGSKKEEEG